MKELAKEYEKSILALNKRVGELTDIKQFLIVRTKDPEKDPYIFELTNRIKLLRTMLNELKEVTREVEHYFDKGWWRSEKYTFNQRKSRKFVYCEPIYHEIFDESEYQTEDERYVVGLD